MFRPHVKIFCLSLIILLIIGCSAIGPAAPRPSNPTATPDASAPQPANLPAPDPTATGQEKAAEATTGRQADADVTFDSASQSAAGLWRFDVTVSHPDTGWDDYADGWDVLLPDGAPLKANPDDPFTRLLLHPHETEQPFTRSQSGLEIPAGITTVTVRAHDLVDGWGGQEITVDLTQASGPGFEVGR